MSEIGSGNGSSYPGALDVNTSLEIDDGTLARADVVNDLASAIVAIQGELGTDPSGSKATVKQFLQLDHQTDGTHFRRSAHTASYVVLTTENFTIFEADTTAGDITFTLPTQATAKDSMFIGFSLTEASNSMVITPADGTVGGAASQTYTTVDSFALLWSNGVDDWKIVSGSSALELIADLTPQLGGDLDVNGKSIVSVSNGNILITPDGSGYVQIDGLKWPIADGSAGQGLITDGAGQLSFSSVAGAILQVKSVAVTTNSTIATATFADVAGLSVSITPASASNHILVMAVVSVGISSSYDYRIRLVRDSTSIGIGTGSLGSRIAASVASKTSAATSGQGAVGINFKDSPASTSALTYKVQAGPVKTSSDTLYINADLSDGDAADSSRTISTLIVMEIKG